MRFSGVCLSPVLAGFLVLVGFPVHAAIGPCATLIWGSVDPSPDSYFGSSLTEPLRKMPVHLSLALLEQKIEEVRAGMSALNHRRRVAIREMDAIVAKKVAQEDRDYTAAESDRLQELYEELSRIAAEMVPLQVQVRVLQHEQNVQKALRQPLAGREVIAGRLESLFPGWKPWTALTEDPDALLKLQEILLFEEAPFTLQSRQGLILLHMRNLAETYGPDNFTEELSIYLDCQNLQATRGMQGASSGRLDELRFRLQAKVLRQGERVFPSRDDAGDRRNSNVARSKAFLALEKLPSDQIHPLRREDFRVMSGGPPK